MKILQRNMDRPGWDAICLAAQFAQAKLKIMQRRQDPRDRKRLCACVCILYAVVIR